jgi:DNA primase
MTDSKPSIVAVLEHYGATVPNIRGTGWTPMRCCFHEDGHASASVNEEAFYCHTCGVKGDALALIQMQENCDFKTALQIGQTVDSDWNPNDQPTSGRRGQGKRKTGRKWSPPGRRGRTPWA